MNRGITALICAAMCRSKPSLRLLIRSPTIEINLANTGTALMYLTTASTDEGNVFTAQQLLNHPDINLYYIAEHGESAVDFSQSFDEFLTHALLIHGRL